MITFATFRRPRRNQRADEVSITDDLRKVPAEPEAVPLGDGGLSVSAARLAAEEAAARPVPRFIPAVDPLRATGQQEALAAPRHEAMTDARGDTELLGRVLNGLRGLDVGGRAQEFTRDFRGLPLFHDVARSLGWCGLHREQPEVEFRPWTFATWERRTMAAIDAQCWQARSDADAQAGRASAEIRMELDAYQQHRAAGRAA